jgi:hypothetical protein
MVHCPQCGVANPDRSKFCNECGAQLPTRGRGVRCPMCSHENPFGSEVCERCNARLIPLTVTPPPQEPPGLTQDDLPPPPPGLIHESEPESTPQVEPPTETPAATGIDRDERAPDWLQRVRDSVLPGEPSSSDWAAEPEPELPAEPPGQPDWLGRLEPTELRPSAPPTPETPAAEGPDWLSRLESPSATLPVEPPPEPTEPPDWLSRLETGPEMQPPPEPVEEKPAAPTPVEAEVPDWLELTPAEAEPTGPPPPAEAGVTDWPAEMIPTKEEAAAAPPVGAEVPDWLAELAPAEAEPTEPPPPAEAGVPDWLATMAPAEEEAAAAPPVEAEVPDWLAELAPAEAEPTEPPPPAEAGVPDWLATMAPAEEEAAAAPPVGAEVPDWLAELAPAEAEVPDWPAEMIPTKEEAAAPPPVEAEVPDWLAELAPAEAEPTEPPPPAEAEVPDWLATMAPAEEEAAAAPPVEAEAPDWLAELAPAEAEPTEPPPPAEAEVPDWLATMAPAEEEAAAAPPAEAAVPDWLAELTPAEAEPTELPPPVEVEVSDWPVEMIPTEEEAAAAPPADAEVPDWLAAMAPAEEEAAAAPPADAEVPDWLATMAPAEEEAAAAPLVEAEVPDWLAELAPAEAEPTEPSPPAEAEVPELRTEPPEELVAPKLPFAEDAVSPLPAELDTAGELPEWVTRLKPAGVEPTPEESGLAQAEIPDWLQAMHPGFAPTPVAQEEELVETSGWLAGIAGVVQPGSVVTASVSAPARPDAQRAISAEAALARARLWQELIARSVQPTSLKLPQARVKRVRDRVERWLVYGVVALAVILPIFAGIDLSTIVPLDEPLTTEVGAAYDLINETVVEGAPVLVAFDYDPSYLGELHLQAEVLLHHLAQSQARIMAISLTPEGAGLAQQLFDKIFDPPEDDVSAPRYDYEAGQDYVNLGYLPGEAVGIRSLEFLPQKFRGEAFDGRELKDASVFGGDTNFALNKVSLIVVLTGDANDLRWWVEQTTALEKDQEMDLPLVAGVSAAIEPLVRPYYDMDVASRQIDGLVVGLAGAVDYERELKWEDGPAHIRLSGQLVGQVAVLALILIGMLIYGVSRRGDSAHGGLDKEAT